MHSSSDQNILRLIRIIPLCIITGFMLILVAVIVNGNKSRTTQLIETLRSDFTDNQKANVARQVESVYQQLEYERGQTIHVLKASVKARTLEAYQIIESIYKANQHLSEKEVTQLVMEALRDVRFNDGRGYYFIYKMDGTTVMHPLRPDLEQTSTWELQDTHGGYIARDIVRNIRSSTDGGAFSRWWFQKPGFGTQEFEKIGYAKHFAPYDWFIGTGEYTVDVEAYIQKRMLKWLSEFRFDSNGYIFVLNMEGETIAHIDRSKLSVNQPHLLQLFLEALEKTGDENAAFVRYESAYVPKAVTSGEKISYVKKLPEWGWVIGGGVYLSEIEKFIDKQGRDLRDRYRSELFKILTLCLLLAFVLASLSLAVSHYIGRRFNQYQKRIRTDFKKLEQSQEQLAYQAKHDSLTKLPNRSLLEVQIVSGIQRCRASGKQLAVMFVDLDNFKKVNDQHGHKVGDELLLRVGEKFSQLLRPGDSVARFGGDEFVFCFAELSSKEEAEMLAESVRRSLTDHFILHGALVSTSCSVGVAMYPQDGDSADQLIANADIVLFRSKAQHKGQVMFYDQSINEQVQYDFLLEDELKYAIEREELEVYYQPQVNPRTGQIEGVEALCRWTNGYLGAVSPMKFIQIAEISGQIFAIGDFVLRKACSDMKWLAQTTGRTMPVSINISPKQLLQKGFVNGVYCVTRELDIDCRLITLEITENVFIEELEEVKPIMEELRQLGFHISLDDFGTGFSSLSYLNALPISEIKIDRSFVSNMLSRSQSESLVKTIVAIGHSNRIIVVAEGVETVDQQIRLHQLGCDRLQGYLFSKPVSLKDLVNVVEASRTASV